MDNLWNYCSTVSEFTKLFPEGNFSCLNIDLSHIWRAYWNILEGMISITLVWLWCYSATRGRWFDQPCDPAGMFCNSDSLALHSASFNFH